MADLAGLKHSVASIEHAVGQVNTRIQDLHATLAAAPNTSIGADSTRRQRGPRKPHKYRHADPYGDHDQHNRVKVRDLC